MGVALVPVVSAYQPSGQATAAKGSGQTNDNCVVNSNGKGNCLSTFGVAVGSVNPIYPTQSRSLPVTFSNPNSFEIDIDSYTASVRVPAGSTCPTGSLSVPTGTQRLNPMLKVPRNGTATMPLPVTLLNSVPDSCQRVPFSITVAATAVKK